MYQELRTFSDGSALYFGSGRFDGYCVYFRSPAGQFQAPKDAEYFQSVDDIARAFGGPAFYRDFVKVYQLTHAHLNHEVFVTIDELAQGYTHWVERTQKLLSVLYVTMVAEENKFNTMLGKRIKRLGVHSIIFDGMSIFDAANFMRGKRWQEIDALCRERGF